MSFKFEKLTIWQDSMSYGEKIFKLSFNFPKDEIFNITSACESQIIEKNQKIGA